MGSKNTSPANQEKTEDQQNKLVQETDAKGSTPETNELNDVVKTKHDTTKNTVSNIR